MANIPYLLVTCDEMEILDCMTDNNQSFRQFDKNQVAGFYVDEDFHLVFYLADEAEPIRFRMYVIKDFSINVETLYQVAFALEEQALQNFYPKLMRSAKAKIIHVIHMAPTFRAFFGKEVNEDEGYF